MVQANRIKLIAILGATAVGKSSVAVDIAKKINGEIISCDSMQIYKGMDIGTGKITREQMDGVVHHMINIISPDESFSVGDYVSRVKPIISKISMANKTPILCGGTGLYVSALLQGQNFGASVKNEMLRKSLKIDTAILGKNVIYSVLKFIDYKSASAISCNDTKRVTRALEIYFTTGKPKSEAVSLNGCDYDYKLIILTRDRQELYERINKRVEQMYRDGLVEEVKSLVKYSHCQSMQAIGYKEVIEANCVYSNQLVELTKQKSRNYAKRQITYFKNMDLPKEFVNADDIVKDDIIKYVGDFS